MDARTLAARAAHLRQQRDALHAALIPTLPRALLVEAARALGLVGVDGQVQYEGTDQIAVCADLVLYGLPAGQRLLAEALRSPTRAEVDLALRSSLLRPRYALLRITAAPHPGAGLATALDLRAGPAAAAPVVLADLQLSKPEMVGLHVGTWLLEGPEGAWLTTGTPLAISAELARIAQERRDLEGASLAASVARSQWSLRAPSRPAAGRGRRTRR